MLCYSSSGRSRLGTKARSWCGRRTRLLLLRWRRVPGLDVRNGKELAGCELDSELWDFGGVVRRGVSQHIYGPELLMVCAGKLFLVLAGRFPAASKLKPILACLVT